MAAGACRRSGKEHIIRDNLTRHNYGNTNKDCKRLIYRDICGGGNFITQSAPTNFHQFWTQKILTPGETIEDFKEVTANEKAQLEVSDAVWERPGEELIAEWEDYGGVYNRTTGFGELNGLTDLTAKDMRLINAFYPRCVAPQNDAFIVNDIGGRFCSYPGRTLHKIGGNRLGGQGTTAAWLLHNSKVEAVSFAPEVSSCTSWKFAFSRCYKLHTIKGMTLSNYTARPMLNAFEFCQALVNIEIKYAWADLDFHWSPLISLESLEYIIQYSANTANHAGKTEPMTITLHPDAYARITDELFALAAEKNITIAST